MERVERPKLGGAPDLFGDVAGFQPVDLVERDHDRNAEREYSLGDVAIAGADPLAGGEDDENAVDILERLIDRTLHPLRQEIARPLEPGQVGEDQLVIVAVGDAEDPPARRLRLVGHDRDLRAAERVHEPRLPDIRPPCDGDEPAPQPRPTPPPGWGLSRLPRDRRYPLDSYKRVTQKWRFAPHP
jgi:hypothetical protein